MKFQFTGSETTWVQVPDGSVVLAEPGDVFDLPFNEPGPLWSKTKKAKTKDNPDSLSDDAPVPDSEPDSEPAPDPVVAAPVPDPVDAPVDSAPAPDKES